MIKFISKKELNNLLSKINIINILNLFINLKKQTNGYVANCPFHKEKTPSFFVSEKKQKYYCFGCHKSGNIISFLINYKNINFIDAINFLLKNTKYKYKKSLYVKQNNYNLINLIAELYNKNLFKNINKNNKLLYFLNTRKISIDIIKKFKIGFVDNEWTFLSKNKYFNYYLKKELETLGLIIKKQNIIYDRFRYRIIFPIRNINGDTIGFGARTLDNTVKPKYINSPESKLFSKRKEFYGLYEVKTYTTKKSSIIIVEGYLDVISLHKNGISNAVAILGTAFSNDHLKILKSSYNKIIFCFDGDKAGQRAALRTVYKCLSYVDINVFIGFVILPKNYDPDSYITEHGTEKFLCKVKKATYILDYLYNILSLNLKIDTLNEKIHLSNKLYEIINKIKNPLSKKFILEHFVNNLIKNKIKFIEKKNIYKNKIISLGTRCCFLILKKRNYVNIVNINKLIFNKNIKFNSDIHTFLELIIILKKNINIKFYYLKKKMLGKLRNNKNIESLITLNKNMFIDEFNILLEQMYNYKKDC